MQFIAYILIYPFLWIISILPFRLLYVISDGLYILLYNLVGYRKEVVKENLDLVFPDKSEAEKLRITKAFYHHLCDMVLESIKSMSISEAEMKKRYVFTNIEVLKEIEAENRSIILMCAHYASWEWIFILQRYISHKGFGIYKKLANQYFDKLVRRIRARYNTYLITTKETIPTLIETQKKGELFLGGFASDQSPRHHKAHHWQNFMGIKVPVITGAEMIAKKLNTPIVFFKVKKVKRGFYETTFHKITMTPRDYKDYEITDQFISYIEEQIYEKPEHYLWTHKRWKHRDKVPAEFL
jgi:KDO2-lipid IV(A) lauroyltransferase